MELTFCVRDADIPKWYGVLSGGFGFTTRVGLALEDFFLRELKVSEAYLSERLRTVFLRGHPVDDLRAAVLRDGDELALSAAMPGAVGISMRRESPFGALRAAITHAGGETADAARPGRVTIRLFNFIVADLGGYFLRRGVVVPVERLVRFLAENPGFATRGLVLDGRGEVLVRLATDHDQASC